jgi:hypothetical protein
MINKVFPLIGIVFLIVLSGCSSPNKTQTAKDVLQDWRGQDFSENEQINIPPTPKEETPSGSIECPMQITDYRQRIDGNRVYIEGNVYNYGDSSYKNSQISCVKLYIFFYNKNGDVIGEDYYLLNVGILDYGEKYPFSASANLRSGTERYLVKVRCCNR